MLRIIRAFAWLRWRTLLNALERSAGRDTIGRLATAAEEIGPLLMAFMMVPSALALAGLAGHAGWALTEGAGQARSFEAVRILLLGGCVLAVIGPLVLPASERINSVRLLLLPVPRGVLYLARSLGAATEPWLLLVAVVVAAVPIGLAAGGRAAGAVMALAAGILLVGLLAGAVAAVASAIELAMRDRRRGERLALVFFLLLPAIALIPALGDNPRQQRSGSEAGHSARGDRWGRTERTIMAVMPSEFYAQAARAAAQAPDGASARPLLILAGQLALLHSVAFALFTRVLASPGGDQARRRGRARRDRPWRVPGLSSGASAVAVTQFRLALRTPRGRLTLLSPVVLLAVVMLFFAGPAGVRLPFLRLESGVAFAGFSAAISLLALVPLAMNQFAIDRAGLTLALLTPLDTRALLVGKAAGNALVAAVPLILCTLASLLLHPLKDLALWLCLPLACTATYLLAAPAAAVLSAIFPRTVDLNSIGRGSNAHGTAALLGTLAFAAAGAASVMPIVLATAVMQQTRLAPWFLLVWTAVCVGVSVVLFRLSAAVFHRRRDHLTMLRR